MNVALVFNRSHPAACEAARRVEAHLSARGAATHLIDSKVDEKPDLAPDLIISLGGDGTILRAFHLFEHNLSPLLGINFGKRGFLSGASSGDLLDAVDAALEDDVHKETRTLLDLNVFVSDSTTPHHTHALNDVVLARRHNARVIATALAINGHDIYTLRGDGLIVATATGSTAYALSAGGPVVSPGYDGMVIVPLASHTLVQRALVTAPDDTVTVTFPEHKGGDIAVSVDGHELKSGIGDITSIEITPSIRTLELIKLNSHLFYDTVAQQFFAGH